MQRENKFLPSRLSLLRKASQDTLDWTIQFELGSFWVLINLLRNISVILTIWNISDKHWFRYLAAKIFSELSFFPEYGFRYYWDIIAFVNIYSSTRIFILQPSSTSSPPNAAMKRVVLELFICWYHWSSKWRTNAELKDQNVGSTWTCCQSQRRTLAPGKTLNQIIKK